MNVILGTNELRYKIQLCCVQYTTFYEQEQWKFGKFIHCFGHWSFKKTGKFHDFLHRRHHRDCLQILFLILKRQYRLRWCIAKSKQKPGNKEMEPWELRKDLKIHFTLNEYNKLKQTRTNSVLAIEINII